MPGILDMELGDATGTTTLQCDTGGGEGGAKVKQVIISLSDNHQLAPSSLAYITSQCVTCLSLVCAVH